VYNGIHQQRKINEEEDEMKNKSKRLFATLLAAVLVVGLTVAMPLMVNAEAGPFQATLPLKNASYYLGDIPHDLEAKFEYSKSAGLGAISDADLYGNPYGKIFVEWYWSYNNSNDFNASGCNLFDYDYNIGYNAESLIHETHATPSTDEVGVKYYFAVIRYAAPDATGRPGKRETVTNTARVVVSNQGDIGTGNPNSNRNEKEFRVRKVDENGELLSGAVLALTPNENYPQDPSVITHESITVGGFASFSAIPGEYILTEKQAPAGYNPSNDKHYITITDEGVYLNINSLREKYDLVTFVNKKISTLIKNFQVKKVDENGELLSGAVLTLAPNENYPQDPSVITYTKTTVDGYADFAATPGQYILSEKQAPTGYNATDDKHYITITEDGVFLDINSKLETYKTVTFVNKKIPELNRDDHNAFMEGYDDGMFKPSRNMTRAEAVVMFSRLLAKKMNLDANYRNNYYPDVPAAAWYSNFVGYMQSLGVLTDYCRDEKFRPNDPVTRAEFATLAAHFDNLILTDTNSFPDVPDDHWAVKYINSAAAKGWITGYPNGNFGPEDNIIRAQVVTLVGRMLDRKADSAYLAANAGSLPKTYPDVDPVNHWAYLEIMEASISHDYVRNGENEQWTAVH